MFNTKKLEFKTIGGDTIARLEIDVQPELMKIGKCLGKLRLERALEIWKGKLSALQEK